MTDLILAVDPGGSYLRGFGTLKRFSPELLLMEPEVAQVPAHSLELYEQNKVGNADPENSAWVEYGGKSVAVGFLARKRFHADLQLTKRKFELALPKVLALAGVMMERHSLTNGSSLRLGLLLPWGEYQDRKRFERLLSHALANFKFRGTERSLVLESCICLPEGGGVLSRGRPPGTSLKALDLAVIMVGFRDVSVLVIERGEISAGYTEPLGFSKLIDAVKAQTSGLNPHVLVEAICKAGKGIAARALEGLVSQTEPELRAEELTLIRQAIAVAREEYWSMLQQWLRPRVPRSVAEVILAGGTARYFRSELSLMFKQCEVNWCDRLEEQLENNYRPQIEAQSLQHRLTDVYGLFFYTVGTQNLSGNVHAC